MGDLIETVPKTLTAIARDLGISDSYMSAIKHGVLPPRWRRPAFCAYFGVSDAELRARVLASAVARETRRRERMLAGAT